MRMKKTIFNYFIEKCVEKQKALLGVDFKTAILSLVLSHTSLVRRYAHGLTTEEIYKTNRYYLEELFLILCFEAMRYGHNLFGYFKFRNASSYRQGDMFFDHIEDADLDKYLEEIFPATKSEAEVPYPLYEKLTGLSKEELLKKSYRVDNLCKVEVNDIDVSITSREILVVEETWIRLMEDEKFVHLLTSSNKHTPQGQSIAVAYLKTHYAEELKRHVH